MDEGDGQPSRWNTLHAMRVLAWSGRAKSTSSGTRAGEPAR
jgi:hypothetical protein